MLNDENLIAECLKNNRKAQKLLYDKYSSKLMGVCLRYTNSRQDAEDVLIEGFINIFQKLSMYSGEGSFEGWMKRIMINGAISHYRANNKYRFHEDIEDCYEIKRNEETAIERLEVKQLLKLIETMPKGYKMIFNFFVVEGYSHREIAEMLDISEGTSKSQFSKARKWLQNKLAILQTDERNIGK